MPVDLAPFDAVLLDLDGTVYHEDHALPGAIEFIRHLQATGKPYACLTNSTTGPRQLSARLARMGVTVDPAHIYTAGAATCDYVLHRYGTDDSGAPRKPRVFNLSTDGVHEMLDGRVHWVQHENDGACDVVICGAPLNVFATEDRQRAALVLLRRGADLVGICADRVYPSPRGIEFGVGPMTAMFAYAANKTPVFCGKPEPIFFTELCLRLGVRPERCVLVGDNLESDVAGGKRVGMTVLLVLTGITAREDAACATPPPDGVIADLTDLL